MNRQRHESPAMRGPRPQVLLALCAAGVVLFNFPLLMVWDNPVTLFGLPLLPVALFAVWAVLIVALALVCEAGPRRGTGGRVLEEENGAGGAGGEGLAIPSVWPEQPVMEGEGPSPSAHPALRPVLTGPSAASVSGAGMEAEGARHGRES